MAGPRVIYAEDYLSDNYNVPTAPRIVYDEDENQESKPKVVYADEYNVDTIVPKDDGGYVNLDYIFQDYGDSLTKEDILKDDRLMDVVRSSLEARYTPGGVLTKARRGATALAGGDIGGLSFDDYRSMDNEEVFEIWQNYQRSFAGGQTVTTANEITYGMQADDDTKAKLGAGYVLFDQMDNAFTGEGSWREMGDAMWDYTKSAVYDPSTILSFGLGKAFGFAGTKASGMIARNMMTKAYQNQLKKGVAKQTALKTIGAATLKALPAASADAVIGAGVDVAYQMQLINVNAQKEYSAAQTAFSAAGSLVVIPTLVGLGATAKEFRKSDLAPQWLAYKRFDDTMLRLGAEEAEKELNNRVKRNIVVDSVDENFGIIKGESKDFLAWIDFRSKAGERIEKRGEKYSNTDAVNAFFDYFWFGSPDGKSKGYYQALKEAGWVLHPAMKEKYKTTGAFAQTIKFLQPRQAKAIVKKFEDETGIKLKFYDENGDVITGDKVTPVSLASHFASNASYAGKGLWISSHLSRLEKAGLNTSDALDMMKPTKGKDDPRRFQYTLSVYKRLLTSHLATTGANLKGFTQLVSLNSAADFVTAGINLGQSKAYKAFGNAEKAEQFYNRAWGSAVGAAKRGFDVLSPDIPIEYADKILSLNPEVMEKLFRDVSGDGGVRDALPDFDLDKIKYKGAFQGLDEVEQLAWKTVDTITKGAQTLTLVRMQDELTKRWAFGTNVNQAIMREYGITAEDFFAPQKANWAYVEMATDRFKNNVLEKAAFRTMRETASVNWSRLQGQTNNWFRAAAKEIEVNRVIGTNNSALGFIVPFGSFLNTTVATAADLTGVNAMRFSIRKVTGQDLDYATQEATEAYAKAIVGWSAIAIGVYGSPFGGTGAKERIGQGLSYNQDPQPDGSIQDRRYDWPASTQRLMSQIVAHGLGDSYDLRDFDYSQVPDDLKKELALQLGGQAVRDLSGFEATVLYSGEQLLEGNTQPFLDMLGGAHARVVQGMTRPLDPINMVTGLLTDGNMNPDRRQGAEIQNQMFRYIDNIIGTSKGLPERATPTRGTQSVPDTGKQVLGVRTVSNPNLAEKMMNRAGVPYWKSIRFDGPAEVRNKMDAIAAPFFESAAIKALRQNPDYFDMTKQQQVKILETMASEVRSNVLDVIEKGMPKEINLVRILSNKDQKELKNVMKFLGIEGDIEDLAKEEDGLSTLLKIQTLLDNYDDIFFGDLKLD